MEPLRVLRVCSDDKFVEVFKLEVLEASPVAAWQLPVERQ